MQNIGEGRALEILDRLSHRKKDKHMTDYHDKYSNFFSKVWS